MPKISIITATYNRGSSLARCLDSVADQTYADIEHIIIDNLSIDNTQKLVKEYQSRAKYPVKYIREADTGIYNALNKGIMNATGEYVHFLHSDDYYLDSNVLRDVTGKMGEHDLVCGAIRYGLDENKFTRCHPHYDDKFQEYVLPHTGIFFRRKFFMEHGLYNEKFKMNADAIYGLRYYPRATKLYLDRDIVFMKDTGLSNNYSLRIQYERMIKCCFYAKRPFMYRLKLVLSVLKKLILSVVGR